MIAKETIDYYQRNLADHGPDAKGMGWRDKHAQKARFDQLIKIVDSKKHFSINDLGCGAGHFLKYLQSEYKSFDYHGYDVLDEMVLTARKKFKSVKRAEFAKVSSGAEMRHSDYTVASGIFNLKFKETTDDWKSYIIETLHQMDKASKRGFAFNALTRYSDEELMRPELYYSDPLWLFDYCKRNFSRNVALLHDYILYDFTILVKKKL